MRPLTSFFGGVVGARLPIRAAFCSSWDRTGLPIHDCDYFPYQWSQWKYEDDSVAGDNFRYELARKARNGITHVCFSTPNGTAYSGPDVFNVPFTPNWRSPDGTLHPDYLRMIRDALAVVPFGVFYCYGGGQTDAPNIYNGNLRRMARQLKAEGLASSLIVNWAWESFGRDPECTAKQNTDAWQILDEELGSDGLIGAHVGSGAPQRFTYASAYGYDPAHLERDCRGRDCVWSGSAWVEVDDPSGGDEIGAWYVVGGRKPGVYLGQLPLGVPAPGSYEARLIEGLDRYLPTGTPIPLVGQGTFRRDPDEHGHIDDTPLAIGPFWFGGAREGGVLLYAMWEPGLAFVVIRKQCTQQDIINVSVNMSGLGITSQGCLPVGA